MTQHCTYSPLPRSSYFTKCKREPIKTLSALEHGEPIWNLWWLSYPNVDKLPDIGEAWHTLPVPNEQEVTALWSDVEFNLELRQKLSEHPAKFLTWFERQDISDWYCYKLMGEAWRATIIARARVAVSNLAGLVKVDGNVFSVRFGGSRVTH